MGVTHSTTVLQVSRVSDGPWLYFFLSFVPEPTLLDFYDAQPPVADSRPGRPFPGRRRTLPFTATPDASQTHDRNTHYLPEVRPARHSGTPAPQHQGLS